DVRLDRAERIVRTLRTGSGERVEDRRFTDVRKADDADGKTHVFSRLLKVKLRATQPRGRYVDSATRRAFSAAPINPTFSLVIRSTGISARRSPKRPLRRNAFMKRQSA